MLLIVGIIGIVGLVVMTSIAAGIILLSKMAVVVALGLGPLFVCCLMFPATAGWFDSWLKTCLTYVLTAVIVAAFLVIFINVYLKVVEHLTTLFATGGDSEGATSGALAYAITILLVTVISSFVMLQSPNIAASLAGGVSVASMSLTGMLKQSGAQVAGGMGAVSGAAKGAGKMTYGAANIASRGALERGASGLSQNVANRYAQHMRRDGNNSINS
jgi:type IV secretory pathway VirB6-like protein